MPYPDNYSTLIHDAQQGLDDAPSDAAEMEWIKSALEMLNDAADRLRGVEASDALLTDTYHDAGREIEILVAAIARRMP